MIYTIEQFESDLLLDADIEVMTFEQTEKEISNQEIEKIVNLILDEMN